jgi:hypothetical protein
MKNSRKQGQKGQQGGQRRQQRGEDQERLSAPQPKTQLQNHVRVCLDVAETPSRRAVAISKLKLFVLNPQNFTLLWNMYEKLTTTLEQVSTRTLTRSLIWIYGMVY